MRKMRKNRAGFTLIELMIVVAILGILAAIAIPAFATYIRRSKAAEASLGIDSLFKASSAYYNKEFTVGANIASATLAHCEVAPGFSMLPMPSDVKINPAAHGSFAEGSGLGFDPGYAYYRFENTAAAGACGLASTRLSAVLVAYGNLDGDGTTSVFSLATATNQGNEMYKAGQMFISNELE